MNISQLHAFLSISNGLNVTETAKKLFCTQPSISIKIKKLEAELQTTLFERINNRLYLTPQGEVYKKYATQIINLMKSASEHIHQFDNPSNGVIKFGASHTAGVYLLPKILSEFKKIYPQISFCMDISNSKQLIKKLEERDLEFLILSDYVHLDSDEYILSNFMNDPFVLICSPHHWLAKKRNCQLSDIESETFLIKPSESATCQFLFRTIKNKNINRFIEINSSEGIKQGVIHELGISIVSKLSINQELNSGILCAVNFSDIEFNRGIRFIYHKEKHISPATKNFLFFLKNKVIS